MGRRVAIVQSCYIPWRGLFAIVASSDAFVFLDSVQFTRRDWRTRNRIKTPHGTQWLSIPVQQKGNYHAPIDAMMVADGGWAASHLRSIHAAYRRADCFDPVFPALERAYADAGSERMLSAVNRTLMEAVCRMMDISTPLLRDIDLLDRTTLDRLDPTERLVELAVAAGADTYISGPSARSYLDESHFTARGIEVCWARYDDLPPYKQLWGDYDPAVSIVDTLLNLGPRAARGALGGANHASTANAHGK